MLIVTSFTVVFAQTNDILFVRKNYITDLKESPLVIERAFLVNNKSPVTTYRIVATKQDIIEYIYLIFKDVGDFAVGIAQCESGLKPSIMGDHGSSFGLFQLHRPSFENWDDYKHNTDLAYSLYQKRGWNPWSCAKEIY